MRPLLDPRPVKDTPRYWFVETEEHGQHHFRFPSYGRAYQILHFAAATKQVPQIMRTFELAGIAIGFCWWHRAFDLEAKPPHKGASDRSLSEYSDQVIDELQEAGYDDTEIEELFVAVMGPLNAWADDVKAAKTPTELKKDVELDKGAPDPVAFTEEDGPDPGPFVAPGATSTASP